MSIARPSFSPLSLPDPGDLVLSTNGEITDPDDTVTTLSPPSGFFDALEDWTLPDLDEPSLDLVSPALVQEP